MRIGVLTFLNANNYGAALQAFSLFSKLQEFGFDVEMIDYRCPAIEIAHSDSVRTKKGIKVKFARFVYNQIFKKRREKFESFRACLKKSATFTPYNIFPI